MHALSRQVMVGGTNQSSDLSRLKTRAPDILVATPGRLNDNLSDAAVAKALRGIRSLVFDEADRLLDMGFRCTVHRQVSHSNQSWRTVQLWGSFVRIAWCAGRPAP